MDLESEKAATVFLSYSREDQKRALPVIKALEAAGIRVWWDGLLEGGDNFLPTTEKALETADAVVVLWSKVSVESHWVRDEAQRGRERGCLVPLRIDDSKPPLGFRQFQVINISKWRGKPGASEIEQLVRAVWGFAGRPPEAATPKPRQPMLSRRAAIGGAAAVAAGGAAVAAWKFGIAPGRTAPGNSVAVLPFRNLSGDSSQDYFSEGISEQIRLTLSRNSKLLVLAPTSTSLAAKEGLADLKSLASKLGVAFVLSGAVRRSGGLLRISANLTDGESGFSSWTDEFDKALSDVFAVQEDIAEAVAAVLAAETAGEGKHTTREPGSTSNLKAYDAYLRGNAYYNLRSGEAAYRSALAQYDAAIAEDPDFAAAHAARSRVIVVITMSGAKASEFKAAFDDALGSARKAVALAPDFAAAHSTLGYALIMGRLDMRGAAAPYQRAYELGAGDASVLSLYSAFAAQTGQKAKAEQAASSALKLDPLNPGVHRMAAFVAYCMRDWPLAIARGRKALTLNPQIDQAHAFIGDALYQQGSYAQAQAEYQAEPEALYRLTGLTIEASKVGNSAAAKQASDKLIADFGDSATYQQAQILAQTGQPDAALAQLLHAREVGDSGLALAYIDPMLDPLRGRADFSRLLTEIGFG